MAVILLKSRKCMGEDPLIILLTSLVALPLRFVYNTTDWS